jgi:hypothetical protein
MLDRNVIVSEVLPALVTAVLLYLHRMLVIPVVKPVLWPFKHSLLVPMILNTREPKFMAFSGIIDTRYRMLTAIQICILAMSDKTGN